MGETLSNWILFIASMVFIVGFFRLTGWRPLGGIFIVIGWQRLVFYVRWLIYSRRYDKVYNFIAEADRRRRQPVAGLVESPKEEPSPQPRVSGAPPRIWSNKSCLRKTPAASSIAPRSTGS
jgi:hypothetical protein